ncbi:type III secretion protein V [Sinorhizobium terangae]|uniref:Type III secretion system protein n=1 Tax=Sinorhizobium terangae TaxID=110322 RepID=A0A6N7LLT4_SINTE|nr:flagellar biosynthesis protein FlhA [Sinorhizobium terangae]MBB4189189.1 type III secretion protein V [Sinorhizobium terangae]MQX18260.1 type III secretion system protein [Sinorhizobium terangae]
MIAGSSVLSGVWRRTDILFAVFFALVLAMMVVPLPTVLVDAMIAFNLAFAFIVLITTIYLRNILDISTFPAVILIGTVFRLSLTISTTRLVLAEGDAGEIIHTFGSFVVAGNVLVGLVVFLIIALVQFIVVTKGAERIAEVGARFTLDAMPGKQLAIDSDLRNGHITAEKAQKRRAQLERESQFFGAMDGAMRFVKGDAIAGLAIVAVNLLGGLAIGIFQRGLSFSESAHLYSLLSVGDGLVSQIPSMLMAIAAGTVVTRVNDDSSTSLGTDIGRQLVREPRALGVAAAMTALMSFAPGFPDAVLWPISGVLAFLAFTLWRRRQSGSPARGSEEPAAVSLDRTKYGDPIIATVSAATMARLAAEGLATLLDGRIGVLAKAVGVAITVPTFNADPRMGDDLMHIQVENVPAGLVQCPPSRPAEQIANDIARIVRRHIGSIFSVEDAAQWLASLEPRLGKLASDVRAQVPPMLLVAVMRRLLDSGVTVSQPRGLLEALLTSQQTQAPEDMAERARQALGRQIAFGLLDQRGLLPVITLGPEWKRSVRAFKESSGEAEAEACENLRRLVKDADQKLSAANAEHRDPVAIVESDIRLLSQALLIRHGCRMPVLSPDDISEEITCDVIAAVGA